MTQKRLGQSSKLFLRYGLHKFHAPILCLFEFDKFFEKRNNVITSPFSRFYNYDNDVMASYDDDDRSHRTTKPTITTDETEQ